MPDAQPAVNGTSFPVAAFERSGISHAAATYRPVCFRRACSTDARALEVLLESQPGISVFDSLSSQLRDLIRTRHPDQKLTASELEARIQEHVRPVGLIAYGVWIYYPWSSRLVHLLDRDEFIELRTNRNKYLIAPCEQEVLACKRIGIAGLSAGKAIATVLALERSCGELRLADFDSLDLSNMNRVRAGVHEIGLLKVHVTAREVAEIDPFLKVTCFPDGVTSQNLEEFLTGDGRLDLVFEECDSLDVKVQLREAARRLSIPVVMATGNRGMLDVERYDLEPARALFHGLAGDLNPSALAGLTTEEKVPWVLKIIGKGNLSDRARASLVEIEQTVNSWPQLASAVMQAGAAAADVARRMNLGQFRESGRFFVDVEQVIPDSGFAAPPIVDQAAAKTPLDLNGMLMIAGTAGADAIDSGRVAPSRAEIAAMVSEAIRAPSGGNSQPWRWLSRNGFLYLFPDRERSSSLADFKGLGAMVALGAAAEIITLAAHHLGLDTKIETFPGDDSISVVRFSFFHVPNGHTEPHNFDALFPLIGTRYTDRGISDRRPLRDEAISDVSEAVQSVRGIQLQIVQDEDTLDSVAQLVGVADRLRMLSGPMHAELMREIRWTNEETEASRDGLDIRTLGLTGSEKAVLNLLRRWESVELLRNWSCGRGLERMARKAIASASAVGLITASGTTPLDYFAGGRAMLRGWLTPRANRSAFTR